jgi:hypothetical protein
VRACVRACERALCARPPPRLCAVRHPAARGAESGTLQHPSPPPLPLLSPPSFLFFLPLPPLPPPSRHPELSRQWAARRRGPLVDAGAVAGAARPALRGRQRPRRAPPRGCRPLLRGPRCGRWARAAAVAPGGHTYNVAHSRTTYCETQLKQAPLEPAATRTLRGSAHAPFLNRVF